MPVQQTDHYKVQDIKAMQKMPKVKEAEELLRKVAGQIQPIMRKRQLRVPLLAEFYPKASNLLGMNHGGGGGATHKISLRLRHAGSTDSFLPYNSIVCTMLHELCHNHIGPHNTSFYTLLGELTKVSSEREDMEPYLVNGNLQECEDLMARGVTGTGEGFDAAAAGRVGGRWRNPTEAEKRLALLAAAEKRHSRNAKLSGLMPSGAHQLGGWKSAASPAEAAALAAMRRAKDSEACGCDEVHGTQVSYDDTKGEVILLEDDTPDQAQFRGQQAAQKSGQDRYGASNLPRGQQNPPKHKMDTVQPAIDSGKEGVYSWERPASHIPTVPGETAAETAAASQIIDLTETDDEGEQHRDRRQNVATLKLWSCPACTFLNPPGVSNCEICSSAQNTS